MTTYRRTPEVAFVLRTLEAMDPAHLTAWMGLSHGRGFMPRRIKVVTRAKYWHVKVRIGTGSRVDLVYEASWGTGVRSSWARDHDPRGTDWFPVIGVGAISAIHLARWCEQRLGAKYDWRSGLRFVPFIRNLIGDREGRRDRVRFNCSKYGLLALRSIDLEPVPRLLAFRCAPGHFVNSALLADPVNLDEAIRLHEVS